MTSTRYGIGGVEKLLLDMSDKYDFSTFAVSYCNLFCDAGGNGVFPNALRSRGLRCFDIPGRRASEIPRMIAALVRLIKCEHFDVVHLHMLQATVVGSVAAKLAGNSRVVITKHYTDVLGGRTVGIRRLDRLLTRRADHIVAISEYVRNDLLRLSVPKAKISVVYNGVDLAAFEARAAESESVEFQGAPLLGTVGSLTERKGHKYLFEAMTSIVARFPGAHLIVAGEGPELKRLEKLRAELNLETAISIIGFRKNVASLLRGVDLYVHPAIHEPFGIAILEAMAAEKCVIATAVEGVPEIVIDGGTGYLTTAGDARALAKTIINSLENADEVRLLGKNGRQRAEKVFEISKTVRSYERVYKSVSSNRPGRN